MLTIVVLLALLLAHDTWLLPLLQGEFGLTSGTRFPSGEQAPRSERVASFSATGGSDPSPFATRGEFLVTKFEESESAGCVEAMLYPHPIELELAAFQEYLHEEAADFLLDSDSGPIREIYTKCSKYLASKAVRDVVVGHPIELVLSGPGAFRLIGPEASPANKPIKAYSADGRVLTCVTDNGGSFELSLDPTQAWMLRAHTIRPARLPDAAFESFWCTLVIAPRPQ